MIGKASGSASPTDYIGRFAPSPSGPLHIGSLITALASWCDARSNGGKWLMRMEDLDPPRESPKAADQILFAIEALGLHWDGPVLYQSLRHDAYQHAIAKLAGQDLLFACDCTRQQTQENDGIYPGTCRDRSLTNRPEMALRCRVTDTTLTFDDRIQGRQQQNLEKEVGDFVIRRKDGLFAYQLAVVVDDAWQGITDIVRGIDLMDSTPRQCYLQQLLGCPCPTYAHIPIIVNHEGQKLSKQHMATPIDPTRPAPLLLTALTYLNQNPDPALSGAAPCDILAWAVSHWNPARLTGIATLQESS
jgi:glutamyl-Q tRNA(Asp) synthetase